MLSSNSTLPHLRLVFTTPILPVVASSKGSRLGNGAGALSPAPSSKLGDNEVADLERLASEGAD
ncbi:hypothetical protein U9M48_039533 [Paspalum notatum var. saurae]|uniref:Uncharacterized protein n=1 Tax=Paspalum notatum var. saurae TaxID=547442 RepID=A0AAQ3ULI8_PASNO